jgi:hypothetical protein
MSNPRCLNEQSALLDAIGRGGWPQNPPRRGGLRFQTGAGRVGHPLELGWDIKKTNAPTLAWARTRFKPAS